jgi:SAM-dependent methyltransferase
MPRMLALPLEVLWRHPPGAATAVNTPTTDDIFDRWLAAASTRYLADLTMPELTRALRALSSCYVERRAQLASGQALASAGKRAAFALFYAPLHFMTVDRIARELLRADDNPSEGSRASRITVDLGCGTGAAGAAWALATGAGRVEGYDINPWAAREARWSYDAMGLHGSTHRVPIDQVRWQKRPTDMIAAFVLNELADETREAVRPALYQAARDGHRVLLVEPIAKGAARWWTDWHREALVEGGRADEWRFRVELPELLGRLDRAAGLDHRELTARSLALGF